MRSFYTDPLGFTAYICLLANRRSARVTVRSPEGSIIHLKCYDTWDEAVSTLRFMLPKAINDLTHKPV